MIEDSDRKVRVFACAHRIDWLWSLHPWGLFAAVAVDLRGAKCVRESLRTRQPGARSDGSRLLPPGRNCVPSACSFEAPEARRSACPAASFRQGNKLGRRLSPPVRANDPTGVQCVCLESRSAAQATARPPRSESGRAPTGSSVVRKFWAP